MKATSSIRTPAPSPITNPFLLTSKGLEAVVGESLCFVARALILVSWPRFSSTKREESIKDFT